MTEDLRAPFLFIVGQGRSGTTLVRAILDSSSVMAIPGESHFVIPMTKSERYGGDGRFEADRFADDLLAHPRFKAWEVPEAAVRRAFDERRPPDAPEAIRTAFGVYAHLRGKRRYGDKTPVHVHSIGYLASTFPDARFIHVIRDGRDVALSYMDVAWGPRTVPDAILSWRRAVRRGRRAGRRLGSDRYREVRYEDLVDEPKGTVLALCPFVELPFHEEMLRYFERAADVVRPSGSPQAHRNLFRPPTKGLRDWRHQMVHDDLEMCEVLAGDLLRELGYEPGIRRPNPFVKMRARERQLRFEGSRAAHRAGKTIKGFRRVLSVPGSAA